MKQIEGPFSWANATVPPAPDFGNGVYAGFDVKYKNKKIKCDGGYAYRSTDYLNVDEAARDDHLFIRFDGRDLTIDFREVLHQDAPIVIEAFQAEMSNVAFFSYGLLYEQKNADAFERLRADPSIDVDGRNNIFTLGAANFWNGELCGRALGFNRDEVIRRLTGKVPLVKPLMDGVYVVFSDNPDLTFEEYCAYNDALKPVLGLI